MRNLKRKFEQLKKAEEELTYATPKRAAKLTEKIVRIKSQMFTDSDKQG